MAQRRMMSLKIIDTDLFLEMSQGAQNLYFHFIARADDDGFVSSPKKIMKIVSSADDDLKVLIAKKFVIPFESGICVIRHWRIHNFIRSDRYDKTVYLKEKNSLECEDNVYSVIPNVIPNDNQRVTQVRIGKDRIGKDRVGVELTPSQRIKKFLSSCEVSINSGIEFLENCAKKKFNVKEREEINKFVSYWTELNGNGTKQRWELEKTFDLVRRVSTWLRNADKFSGPFKQQQEKEKYQHVTIPKNFKL